MRFACDAIRIGRWRQWICMHAHAIASLEAQGQLPLAHALASHRHLLNRAIAGAYLDRWAL